MTSTITSTTYSTYTQTSTSSNATPADNDMQIDDILAQLEQPTSQTLTAEQQDVIQFMNSLSDPAQAEGSSLTTSFVGIAATQLMARENELLEATKAGASMPGFYPDEVLLERKIMTAYMKGENIDAMQKELDALRSKNRAN